MTTGLVIQGLVGLLLGAIGLVLLLRPGVVRALVRVRPGEANRYVLRIIGAMSFAAGLFLGGFAAAYYVTVEP